MACDKPTGDCTDVSPCGSATGDCGGTNSTPVLPKCQDVLLLKGVYKNAKITVNAEGCITNIESGEPEIYAPDDCCGGGSGGGDTTGSRGPRGEPGPAATISVERTIETNQLGYWTVENVGTTGAAILRFTAPANAAGSGTGGTGATGNVNGLRVESGLVKAIPSSLITNIRAVKLGDNAGLFNFTAAPTNPDEAGNYTISLNLDLLYTTLKEYTDSQVKVQKERIDALEATVVDLNNRVVSLEGLSGTPGVVCHNGFCYNATEADVTLRMLVSPSGEQVPFTIPANTAGYNAVRVLCTTYSVNTGVVRKVKVLNSKNAVMDFFEYDPLVCQGSGG